MDIYNDTINWLNEYDEDIPDQADYFFQEDYDNLNVDIKIPTSINEDVKEGDPFKIELMDIDKFIKYNPSTKEITNPSFFKASGGPTSDGLLSNEIFGITQFDRANIYGYIDLVEWFIQPSCFKALTRLDRKFTDIIYGNKLYSIDKDGKLYEDPEHGGTGIKWIKDNFEKFNFYKEDSTSIRRDNKISYILRNYKLGRLFINKWIVIPPYYRDVNTSGKYTGVGQINKLYVNLIVAARALRENNDYGLSIADSTCGRIQDTLKTIYDWFCGNANPSIVDKGTGLSGKFGLIKRANLSKTSDYSSRLVLTAPELKVETKDDLMSSLDKTCCPLPAIVADFYPFMMFHMRRTIDTLIEGYYNEYSFDKDKLFNDDIIDKQLKKFLYSYDTRFFPFEIEEAYRLGDDKKTSVKILPKLQISEIEKRYLTWTDIIFIAAHAASEGKIISFTRYPIDSSYNTIYTGIEIASTKETEPLTVFGKFYKFYPKIRDKDINTHTKDKFIDTIQVSNLYLEGMGADYDGDTGVIKGSFFKETNEELKKFMNSKGNFINLGCENIRKSSKEAVQSMYNFTKVLPEDLNKLTAPQF